ncbi:MAG: SAM-dependent methyltransferase, partial [Candidatus Omnitrophica bacterium]|nr:SAM-dependent methyltransferase [Candidatus Omnitrophota bacterium]
THQNKINEYLGLLKKTDTALISEAGCPCVADPGADLVSLAHQNGVKIIPLVGPTAIILALMASGLNGQNFAFNGYLPKERKEKIQKIKMLQERSKKEGQTQIFMETPYRNQNMLEDILLSCDDKIRLCVAFDITGSCEMIQTKSIKEWKSNPYHLDKKPALFLVG